MNKIFIIGFGITCVIISIGIWKWYTYRHVSHDGELLESFLQRKQALHIYVGYPLHNPVEWIQVQHIEGNTLEIGTHGDVQAHNVKSFLVTYPGGEVLYPHRLFYPLPDGVYFMESHQNPSQPIPLNRQHIADGRTYVTLSHGTSKSQPHNPEYYSTSFKNISEKKIRVMKFAAFAEINGQYFLSTVSGQYFTAQQFQEWYAVGDDGWIQPGETVTDWDSYGEGGQGIWAYFCEDENGKEFIATVALPK